MATAQSAWPRHSLRQTNILVLESAASDAWLRAGKVLKWAVTGKDHAIASSERIFAQSLRNAQR
jgi:hypothetical protein